jgi:hypothetical protein
MIATRHIGYLFALVLVLVAVVTALTALGLPVPGSIADLLPIAGGGLLGVTVPALRADTTGAAAGVVDPAGREGLAADELPR